MPSERVQRRIDSLLDKAEQASDDYNWDLVLDLTARVLEADPDNADAQTFRAMAEASLRQSGSTPPPVPSDTPSATVEDAPTSLASGRYEVKSLLGEGGKKKVYLAHDTTLDRDVAFGLIKAEGLDADSRQRITREALAIPLRLMRWFSLRLLRLAAWRFSSTTLESAPSVRRLKCRRRSGTE
jgi:hypothetical protein